MDRPPYSDLLPALRRRSDVCSGVTGAAAPLARVARVWVLEERNEPFSVAVSLLVLERRAAVLGTDS